jgi:hypothetical protein
MSVKRRAVAISVLLLVAVLGAACSGATSSPAATAGAYAGGAGGTVDSVSASKGNIPTVQGSAPNQSGVASLASADRDLIVTANIAMKSDDPWQTADGAKAIARRFGGSIVGLSESINNDRRTANLTMRVPSASFDDAINALKSLDGTVIQSSVDAKDVTDQLVDIDARLVALRAEETRYLQLFTSAKTVDEMLKVQMALSQLRQQIEQLAAAQKSTKDRVAFSTISLSVASTAEPLPATPGKWDPARTFAVAIASFATLLRFMADLAIWFIVFCGIPLLVVASILVATRARRRPPAA